MGICFGCTYMHTTRTCVRSSYLVALACAFLSPLAMFKAFLFRLSGALVWWFGYIRESLDNNEAELDNAMVPT